MTARPPYKGLSRKLVLAFDIGTTSSVVSYWYVDVYFFKPNLMCSVSLPASRRQLQIKK